MKKNFYKLKNINYGDDAKLVYSILIRSLLLFSISGVFLNSIIAQPIADGKDKFLGNVLDNTMYSHYTKYWNQVTPGNAGKWGSVEGARDSYNWTQLDNIYNYAISNSMTYKHHTLVWGNQQPSWISSLDSAEQHSEVEEWIRLVGERYPDMDFIDVVNEPFNAPPSYMQALGGSGETGWDWVVTSFELARKYCAPDVKLILNEYNVLGSNSVTSNYIALIDILKVRGLIDGIGVQGHYFEFKSPQGGSPSYSYSISTIKSNLNKLTSLGLPFYITEFDINEENDEIQLQNYKTYFPIFWEHPGVKGITLWGYVLYDMWQENAYLINERHVERPALKWLRNYVISPSAPIIISPKVASDISRNPMLIWQESDLATSYNVQVSTNSSFVSVLVDTTVTDTTVQLDTLNSFTRYYWRVSASNDEGTSEFSNPASFSTGDDITNIEETVDVPTDFKLFQNYPNPFNPTTIINFSIPEKSYVTLKVYNLLGEEVASLFEGLIGVGIYSITFDGSKLTAGVYFYRLQFGNLVQTKKLMLLK